MEYQFIKQNFPHIQNICPLHVLQFIKHPCILLSICWLLLIHLFMFMDCHFCNSELLPPRILFERAIGENVTINVLLHFLNITYLLSITILIQWIYKQKYVISYFVQSTGVASLPVPSGISDNPSLNNSIVLIPNTRWTSWPATNWKTIPYRTACHLGSISDKNPIKVPDTTVIRRCLITNIPHNLYGGVPHNWTSLTGDRYIAIIATRFTINAALIKFILLTSNNW